jgi:hypothetical protein
MVERVITRRKKNTLRRRNTRKRRNKSAKRYSLKNRKDILKKYRGGDWKTAKRDIMNNKLAKKRCRELRKKSSRDQLTQLFKIFQREVNKLHPKDPPYTFKCFYECTEKRKWGGLDWTNRPVIFLKVIKIINDSAKISGVFGGEGGFGLQRDDLEREEDFGLQKDDLEREEDFGLQRDDLEKEGGFGLLQMDDLEREGKLVLPDVSTGKRAEWFLTHRIPTLESPTLIVTHQDFMKEVIKKLKKRRMEKNIKEHPKYSLDGEIPNLGILHLKVDGVHIFLMRHCFACHNIKDKGVEVLEKKLGKTLGEKLGPALNFYTEKTKKALHYNYGELSVCIQENTDYEKAVKDLKDLLEPIKLSLGALHFGCSPLFRAMFTLIKVLQEIDKT